MRFAVAKPLLCQMGSVKRSLPPADSIGSWYIPKKSGHRESDSRYRGVSGRHRPRRLLVQHPSENSDSLDMSRVRVDSSEVHAWGWSSAELHLRNAGPRRRGPDISRRTGKRRAVGGTVRGRRGAARRFGWRRYGPGSWSGLAIVARVRIRATHRRGPDSGRGKYRRA